MRKRRIGTISLFGAAAIPLALAACQPPKPPAAPDNRAEAPKSVEQAPAATARNEAEPRASIIRPDVAIHVEPKPIEPETLVLPFGFNGNDLDDTAKAALDKLLQTPAIASGGAITVRGHTDSRGFDVDNRRVSQKRADAVRDYLIGKGIPPERITAIGLGEARPIAPNANLDGSDDPQGRERNRRVEVEVAVGTPSTPPARQTDGAGQ